VPEARRAGRASAGSEPEASSEAIARGSADPGRSGATVAPPATVQAAVADWQSLYAAAHRFQLAGNLVAAADAYQRAVGLNPEHPAIHYDLGYVLQMQGRPEVAVDHYRRAIELQPDHGYAHYNLGYLLQSLGDGVAALEHYEVAAARVPGNAFIYYDWAWSLELSGDRAGAAALYRKAIALDPQHQPGIDARRRLAALGRSARLE
jgi:tetratricopeptide (TPR) repeat protein